VDATWPSGEQDGFVKRIAVEVKRTWMGYRAAQNSLPVESAVVIGGSPLCVAIAEAVAEVIEAEAVALVAESFAVVDSSGAVDPTRWLALAGVGVPACGRIDLLNPTKAKAARSKTRERAMLAAMVGIGVVGAAIVFGYLSLADLQDEQETLRKQRARLANDYEAMLLARSRLDHLQALRESRPEWSGHLERVLGHTAASGVRVDQLSGASRGGVWFGDPKGERNFWFREGEYRPAVRGELTVQGVGESRELASMVRGRLVNDPLYMVQTQGPDAGPSFKLEIGTTTRSAPVEPEASGPAEAAGGPGGEP
jgi:hypothetical protein